MHVFSRLRSSNANLCEQGLMGNGCIPVIPHCSHGSAKWLKAQRWGGVFAGGHQGSPEVSARFILIINDLAWYESVVLHLSAPSRLTAEDLSRRWGYVWCEQTLSAWIERHYGWNKASHWHCHKPWHNHLLAVISFFPLWMPCSLSTVSQHNLLLIHFFL